MQLTVGMGASPADVAGIVKELAKETPWLGEVEASRCSVKDCKLIHTISQW
jgi:hypothetical protein